MKEYMMEKGDLDEEETSTQQETKTNKQQKKDKPKGFVLFNLFLSLSLLDLTDFGTEWWGAVMLTC